MDFSVIDHFEKVTDRDAAIMTRRIVKEEAIFVGNSAGSAMAGLLQLKDNFKKGEVVVVIFHDHGTRYVGKMFNDDWMRERGFLDEEITKAEDVIKDHIDKPLVIVRTEEADAVPVIGTTIHVTPRPDRLHSFDAKTGKRL